MNGKASNVRVRRVTRFGGRRVIGAIALGALAGCALASDPPTLQGMDAGASSGSAATSSFTESGPAASNASTAGSIVASTATTSRVTVSSTRPASASTSAAAASSGDAGGADSTVLAPTFTNVYDSVLCAWCIGCHEGSNAHANLNFLSQAQAYKSLYDAKGTGDCANYTLVVPGNATQSVLYRAVAAKEPNGPTNLCGTAMPDEDVALPAALATLVQEWIDQGAPND